MAELGETEDPRELIPGDPDAIRSSASSMTGFGSALTQAGTGLGELDDGGWEGATADAFHQYFDGQPAKWQSCGDSFHSASGALTRYASTLDWAHGEGQRAISLWNRGQQATTEAAASYQQQSAASTGPMPPFSDPGEGLRQQAQGILGSARTQVQSAGDDAAGIVEQAQSNAPQEPGLLGRALNALDDAADWVGDEAKDAVGNIVRSAGDIVDDTGRLVGSAVGNIVRSVGDGTGDLVTDIGDLTGSDDIQDAGRTVTQSMDNAGDTAEDAVVNSTAYVRNEVYNGAQHIDGQNPAVPVYIDSDEYPEAAQHIDEAQGGTSWRGSTQIDKTQPSELTIDRPNADANRRASLKGIPTQKGQDRDEYPPAMFGEGGAGASVKYIDPHDNRGAGSTMGGQLKGLPDGDHVEVITY